MMFQLQGSVLQAEVTKDPVRISSALPPRLIAETKNGAGAVETLLLRRIESNFVHFFSRNFSGGGMSHASACW